MIKLIRQRFLLILQFLQPITWACAEPLVASTERSSVRRSLLLASFDDNGKIVTEGSANVVINEESAKVVGVSNLVKEYVKGNQEYIICDVSGFPINNCSGTRGKFSSAQITVSKTARTTSRAKKVRLIVPIQFLRIPTGLQSGHGYPSFED